MDVNYCQCCRHVSVPWNNSMQLLKKSPAMSSSDRLELLIQQAPEQHETLQPGIMIDINLSVLVCIKP